MLSQRFIWSHVADVHTPLRQEERPASWLISETFVRVLSAFTVYFEDGAKRYSVLTHRCELPNTCTQSFYKAGVLSRREKMTHCCLPWNCRRWCSRLGILTSCHIKFCCVQISCLPEKETVFLVVFFNQGVCMTLFLLLLKNLMT